jgi:hypothetical protein
VFLFCVGFCGFAAGALNTWTGELAFKSTPTYRAVRQFESAKLAFDLWWQKTQEEYWLGLIGDGVGFENALADVFRRSGAIVETTARSGDMGVDLIVHRNGTRTIVQCKAYKKRVGPEIVRELMGTWQDVGGEGAMLASIVGFTDGVLEYSQRHGVQLLDMRGIIEMQKRTVA